MRTFFAGLGMVVALVFGLLVADAMTAETAQAQEVLGLDLDATIEAVNQTVTAVTDGTVTVVTNTTESLVQENAAGNTETTTAVNGLTGMAINTLDGVLGQTGQNTENAITGLVDNVVDIVDDVVDQVVGDGTPTIDVPGVITVAPTVDLSTNLSDPTAGLLT